MSGVLDPVGPVGAGDRLIMLDALAIMLGIVVPVIIATLVVAWWFRAGNAKARRRPDWEFSGQLEFVIWSIPAMVVLFVGGLAWIGSHQLDPMKRLSGKPPMEIDVVSMDWKWLFLYPQEGVASVNELAIPVGQPVEFHLTSIDVMNSFFIPRLGSQIYTMAGMVTRLNLQADTVGSYDGRSVQFSGDGFSDMRFKTRVLDSDAFSAWMAKGKDSPDLDVAAYATLAKPGTVRDTKIYSLSDRQMFAGLVRASAPGSMDDMAMPASSPNQVHK